MTPAPDHPTSPGSKPDPSDGWALWVRRIEQHLAQHRLSPDRLLVLLPYIQLVEPARRAWAARHPSGFAPRLETTRNWASSLAAWSPAPSDPCGDMARDSLVAQALVDRLAMGRSDPSLRAELVARLVDVSRQLAPLAAAVPPAQRAVWAEEKRLALAPGPHWESALASLALAWVGSAGFATDVLWSPLAAPGTVADRLWVLQGFQNDPLGQALAAHWGERASVSSLPAVSGPAHEPELRLSYLQACMDAEDEAQRAAAAVICRVNEGGVPLALVANDRLLTRRISAMLHGAGLSVRDETGWKLSTTHAAAQLMSLLRAADPRARTDDVMDLLKQSNAWTADQVAALELAAREQGASSWRSVLRHPALAGMVPNGLAVLLEGLQTSRPLERWLDDVRAALVACGLWDRLVLDPAGQQTVRVLRLGEGRTPAGGRGPGRRRASGAAPGPGRIVGLGAGGAGGREFPPAKRPGGASGHPADGSAAGSRVCRGGGARMR
jgi:ATP-dependent helicase/nuclease subunit B